MNFSNIVAAHVLRTSRVLWLVTLVVVCVLGWALAEADKTPFRPKLSEGVLKFKNYGPRRFQNHEPVFVIHETAESLSRTKERLTDARYKASFHVLLTRQGEAILYVAPDKKAYTAGRSRFNQTLSDRVKREPDFEPWFTPYNSGRDEAVLTHSGVPSVNDFAYQVEMVSPEDGYWCVEPYGDVMACEDNLPGQKMEHSGYTDAQYLTLAWLAVKTGIAKERITTHRAVELKTVLPHRDPRSFDWKTFWSYYDSLTDRSVEIQVQRDGGRSSNQ